MHVAVAILRVSEGLDYTGIISDFDDCTELNNQAKNIKSEGVENPSFVSEENIATHDIGNKITSYTWLK